MPYIPLDPGPEGPLMKDPRGRNGLANILLFLALPAILIGYLLISRYGFDPASLLRAMGEALDTLLAALRSLAGWFCGRLSDLVWIASPFLVAGLASRTKIALGPGSRSAASGAGILAFFTFWLIAHQMSAAALPFVMGICAASLFGILLTRPGRAATGMMAMAVVLGLTIMGLSTGA